MNLRHCASCIGNQVSGNVRAAMRDSHYASAPENIPGDSFVFAIRTLVQSRRTRW
jgi:hypothetical protein